jgi:hypothetical protein
VPIRPFLPGGHSFDPEDIAKMSAAFEAALRKLGLADRSDPAATAVAKLIIEFAKAGERDPSGSALWRCSNYQNNQCASRLSIGTSCGPRRYSLRSPHTKK